MGLSMGLWPMWAHIIWGCAPYYCAGNNGLRPLFTFRIGPAAQLNYTIIGAAPQLMCNYMGPAGPYVRESKYGLRPYLVKQQGLQSLVVAPLWT